MISEKAPGGKRTRDPKLDHEALSLCDQGPLVKKNTSRISFFYGNLVFSPR